MSFTDVLAVTQELGPLGLIVVAGLYFYIKVTAQANTETARGTAAEELMLQRVIKEHIQPIDDRLEHIERKIDQVLNKSD
jgi:hypothetical protein